MLSAAVITQESPIQEQKLGAVAVLASVASWGDVVSAERYAMSVYYSFVFGVLRNFDMPDLCATIRAPVFVAAPVDAKQELLEPAVADAMYIFAQKINSKLLVDRSDEPSGLTRRLVKWLALARVSQEGSHF